jgi:hypothetical protein
MYLYYRECISAWHKEIKKHLQKMEAKANECHIVAKQEGAAPNIKKEKKSKHKNHSKMDVRNYSEIIHGLGILAIY